MAKNAPTLADAFLRESFKPYYRSIDPERKLPSMIAQARRFVLDDKMSAFMADLAWASLLTCETAAKAQVLLDGMRGLARLPHRLTWIEYSGTAKATRAHNEYNSPINPELTPAKLGWLCWQHPQLDTAFGALEFASHGYDLKNNKITQAQANPFAYAWRSDEGPPPWPKLKEELVMVPMHKKPQGSPSWLSSRPDNLLSISDDQFKRTFDYNSALELGVAHESLLTGVDTYRSNSVIIAESPAGNAALELQSKRGRFDLMGEVCGDLRYLWAFLATINDLPVNLTEVTASKGFVARGSYRKFMNHTTITLNVPEKKYRRAAAQAIAIARRKRHDVRGHWRLLNKNAFCEHEWVTEGDRHRCKRCRTLRTWIHEHQRGDANLGFVLHDYAVKHEDPPSQKLWDQGYKPLIQAFTPEIEELTKRNEGKK